MKSASKLDERKVYAWYLREPFATAFDRSPWWNECSHYQPIAALYEIARRHPRVAAVRLGVEEWPEGKDLDPMVFLCLYGVKPWPKLDWKMQECWRRCAGNMKGVDCRATHEKCTSINKEAIHRIAIQRAFKNKSYRNKKIEQVDCLVEKDMDEHPPSSRQIEAAITMEALTAYYKGHVLIAVAPDLEARDAESLMMETYRQHRKLNRVTKQRARYEDWLPLVSGFEDAELSQSKGRSQIFKRYRTVLDGIRFA